MDINILNANNIFSENNNKKRKNNEDRNIVQDYYQKIENKTDLINNQFNNIHLSSNEKENDDKNTINIKDSKNTNNDKNSNKNINKPKIIEDNNYISNQQNQSINNFNLNPNYLNLNKSKENQVNINNNQESLNINQLKNKFNTYIMNQPQLNVNQNSNIIYQPAKSFLNKNKFSSLPQKNLLAEKRMEYLINNCVSVCKEQMECRQLQNLIDEKPFLASKIIYQKIKDKIQEISFDQFGNYFIQKVIENLTIEQISEILIKKISHNFRSFCFNQHGTRVVQKIFEKIINYENLLNYFNNLLGPNLKDFVIDQNASHIIIKYVNTLHSPKNDFIIKFLLDNSYELAMKKYSCCVLQKCIEYSNDKQKKDFLKEIAMKSFGLFNDQFGNYVVQYCVNLCDFEINKIFVQNFLYNLIKFSSQKYSSNIIEKCMDCCDEETKELICQKYCDKVIVEKLLFDSYGNYVIQKVISLSKEPLTTKYLEIIGPLMKNLNNISFGQKLYNRLIVSFPNLSTYIGIDGKKQKNKKLKNKKNNNNNFKNSNGNGNMNMNEFVNNIYVNNSYNMNNINGNINQSNNGQILMMPGINNNYYIPFQLNNNINSSNINKGNIPLQNLLNKNNFAMNSNNIVNNNMNNLLQLQQALNRNNNNNIDFNNNFYNNNQ